MSDFYMPSEVFHLIQLKPMRESFFEFCKKALKFNSILICEGKSDSELVKVLSKKIGVDLKGVGITDCEGVNNLTEIVGYIISLSKISKRVKKLIVLIDMDEYSPEDRIESLENALRSKGLDLKFSKVNRSIYETEIESSRKLIVLLLGIPELRIKRKCIEDHSVEVMILTGKLNERDLIGKSSSKEILEELRISQIEIIEKSDAEILSKSFSSLVRVLKSL